MSQDRVYAILVGLIVGMTVLMVSSQSIGDESRSEVLERIRPVGQVRIEGQTNPQSKERIVAPAPTPALTETPAAAEPVAKAEPAPAPAAQQAPVSSVASNGAALYTAKGCSACHGADGKRTTMSTYPKLAGQSPEYTYNQMMDIKSGARSSGQAIVMKGIIAQVSEEEMRVIADWLGDL